MEICFVSFKAEAYILDAEVVGNIAGDCGINVLQFGSFRASSRETFCVWIEGDPRDINAFKGIVRNVVRNEETGDYREEV